MMKYMVITEMTSSMVGREMTNFLPGMTTMKYTGELVKTKSTAVVVTIFSTVKRAMTLYSPGLVTILYPGVLVMTISTDMTAMIS